MDPAPSPLDQNVTSNQHKKRQSRMITILGAVITITWNP
jgi:hypothetical protein